MICKNQHLFIIPCFQSESRGLVYISHCNSITVFTDLKELSKIIFLFSGAMSVMHSNQSPTPSLKVGIVPPYNNNKFTIMERNLKFLKTMSVAEFKAQHNVEKIEVKRNEHTGKCFFVYGFETGACSKKVETGELTIPVISEVCSAETGDIFLLLHQKGEGGATTLATL